METPQPANVKFVRVEVPPIETGLEHEMKLPEMPGPGDDEMSPDRRLDLGQHAPDLERIGFLAEQG
jgi:hypothetical protein